MRKQFTFAHMFAIGLVLLALVAQPHKAHAEPTIMWETDGFNGPESVVKDAETGELYVSNVNGAPNDPNGKGYISKLSADGKIIDKEWVTGLNAPKGLALDGTMLYVADINKVAVIDTKDGKIVSTYEAPGSTFLNDVSIHKDGRVFISDMLENHIWLLEDGKLSLWLESADLENPNGLMADDDKLFVASWGVPNEDFSTDVPGTLKTVDYDSKKIEKLGSKPVGNLDGLEPDGQGGFLVTDWFNGGLYRFSEDGEAELIMDLNKGSADHLALEEGSVVIIPMMLDNKVVAYRLK